MLCCCMGDACVKKCVLSRDFNCLVSLALLLFSGRSFQYYAVVLLKPLSANDLFLLKGMSIVMLGDVDYIMILGNCLHFNFSTRYWGACPCRAL